MLAIIRQEYILTWDISISVLQSVKVVHELCYGNLEGLKQTRIFEEPVGYLGHCPKKKKN